MTVTIPAQPPKTYTYAPQIRTGPVGPQPISVTDTKKNKLSDQELDKLRKKAAGWKEEFVTQRAVEESMATLWL